MKKLAFLFALVVAVGIPAVAVGTGGSSPEPAFLLGGTAQLAQDPENPANDVVRIRTDVAPFFGTISRTVNTKVDKLDNMLEFKSWFASSVTAGLSKTCIGGSPRLQLAIDTTGDGSADGNAFGYFGASPSFAGCPMDTWLEEDLTGAGDFFITGGPLFPSTGFATPNEELEWDLTQFGGPFYNTWSQVEVFFSTRPHQVCTVALVDDTFGAPGMTGTAYYDLFSAGRRTFTDRYDIAGRGFAKGCQKPDYGGDSPKGDHDRDHELKSGDATYDANRHEHWH
jgi:hypothetical protein